MSLPTNMYFAPGKLFQHLPGQLSAATETLAATRALTAADPSMLKLDPGGAARDVTLDAEENIPTTGLIRWIFNAADAAENLVLKNDAGTTIATVNQNESAIVINDGVQDGTASAWTLYAVVAIALS